MATDPRTNVCVLCVVCCVFGKHRNIIMREFRILTCCRGGWPLAEPPLPRCRRAHRHVRRPPSSIFPLHDIGELARALNVAVFARCRHGSFSRTGQ